MADAQGMMLNLRDHMLKWSIHSKSAKRSMLFIAGFIVLGLLTMVFFGQMPKTVKPWRISMKGVGAVSSPRVADLNGDGILDIVMGAGGKENEPSDTAVIALDGTSGALLWFLPGRNQMVGAAIFMDITHDGLPDVFIGGRSAQLWAVNGQTGQVIWDFFPQGNTTNPADSGWFNFFNPQWIPDQDADGLEDLLIGNGGNYLVKPNDPNRPTGNLLVLSSRSGKILAKAPVPDGKETYSSVIVADVHHNHNPVIVFGTGGETIGGHLYRTTLKDVMRNDLSKAISLASSRYKGFIAPAIFVDLTHDAVDDIVANAVDGRMIAINGANDSLIWQVTIPKTEAYTSPAVGYFNQDSVPDFFANFGIGIWPLIEKSVLFMVNGRTGQVEKRDTLEGFQYASPLAADFNNDGYDDGLISTNAKRTIYPSYEVERFTYLLVFDFHAGRHFSIGDTLPGANVASTPWMGDLNHDNTVELVYCATNFATYNNDIDNPNGMAIRLLETNINDTKQVSWGSYMGSRYDGIFRKRQQKRISVQ